MRGGAIRIINTREKSPVFKLDRNYVFLNKFSKKYKSLNSKWMVKLNDN